MEVLEAFAIPGAAVLVLFLVAFFWPRDAKSSRPHAVGSSRANHAG